MAQINLREALNECLRQTHRADSTCEVYKKDLKNLTDSARFGLQEMFLEGTEEGWLITVCSQDRPGCIEILIPRDRGQRVCILREE